MIKYIVLLLICLHPYPAFAESHNCQYDKFSMIWTGQTKVEWGKIAKEYQCILGHSFWIVEQSPRSSSSPPTYSSGPTCQYDNFSLMWTGETKIEWGQLVKQYRCLSDHIYWLTD